MTTGGLAPALARATPPVETMRPSASTESHITTETSQVLPKWTPAASMANTYENSLTRRLDPQAPELTHRAMSTLLVAFGLFGVAQLDLAMPFVVYQAGQTTVTNGDRAPAQASAIGDLRTGLKGTILRTPNRGFGLGLAFDVTAPTGQREHLSGFGGPTYAPQILLEQRMARGIEAALNVGYWARPDSTQAGIVVGDVVTYRSALRVPLGRAKQVALVGELDGAASVRAGGRHPLTLRGGLRWRMRSGLVLGLYGGGAPVSALGVGLAHGILTVGYAPPHRLGQERAFLGNRRPSATTLARHYEHVLAVNEGQKPPAAKDPRDEDGDTFVAQYDACPHVAEDKDGFEDNDGCPEFDNDLDGIRDALDLCPGAPELVNAYADWDGCPDLLLADGTGKSFRTIAETPFLPALAFEGQGVDLTGVSTRDALALVELLRLNPWIEEVRLDVGGAPKRVPTETPADDADDPDAECVGCELATLTPDLADARARALQDFFAVHGVDPWRITCTVDPTRPENEVHLAYASGTGLRPSGPTGEHLERYLARVAAERDAQKGAPGLAGASVDVMAQGPEEAAKEEETPAPRPRPSPSPAKTATPDNAPPSL